MFCAPLSVVPIRRTFAILSLLLIVLLTSLARADGFIVIEQKMVAAPGPRMNFAFAPLEVTYHHVDVQIHDLVAVTSVDQEFYNPNGQRLEGKYIFPLTAGAHIDKFQMDIDGAMQQAELLDSNKARQFYEEIVRKMRDPALLEYAGRDAFSVRIFPIEPHSTKRIKVSYTQLLKSDSSLVEYSYPLNTEKFSARPLRDVAISVNIKSKEPIKNLYSPSHAVSVRYEGDRRATVGWEAHNLFPDTDFKLLFSRTPKPLGIDLLTYRGSNDDGYFLLMASPGMVATHGTAQSKDICFVIDTSGSMAEDGGKKIEQARKSLSFCLQNLSKEDRFNVIRFSTDVEPLFDNLVNADQADVQKAQEFVDSLRPLGATAINDALLKALSMRPRDSQRPYIIIFITDGLPTVGVTGEDQIMANVQHADSAATRIYCFGLGTDVNTHLLDRLAEQTDAISQYVLPNEDLELKLSDFYAKIKEPVLANVNVKFVAPGARVTELYPTRVPDLYKGQMLVLFGRYSGSGSGSVRISGSVNGANQEFVADINFGKGDRSNDFVPRLWATRRVGYLLDEIRMHGETAELKDEATRLARQWGIVTPYTAYLIVEDETRRNVPAQLQSMRELSTDAAVRASVQQQYYSARAEAKDVRQRSGGQAVENAQSMAQLKRSDNLDAPQQQQQNMGLQKAAAVAARPGAPASQPSYREAQNYAQQARIVAGRAFYQNGQTWTDASAQDAVAKNKNLKARQIKFGSDEYFALMTKYPHVAQWLALGDQVDLMLDGELVQVR